MDKTGIPISKDTECGKRGVLSLVTAGPEEIENGRLDILVDVHGSLTFSSSVAGENYPVKTKNLWWFGFDCRHYGDSIEVQNEEYVVMECERLAEQLVSIGETLKAKRGEGDGKRTEPHTTDDACLARNRD